MIRNRLRRGKDSTMTRLLSEDIQTIPANLNSYDRVLKEKTGLSLKELAALAAGPEYSPSDLKEYRVAVIPVTAGQGTIEGFCEAVAAIAAHLGFNASVTASPDVAGLAEAYQSDVDIILLADDGVFAAVNTKTFQVVDNTSATAIGYVVALQQMAGSLKNREVLLIGAGRLGAAAAKELVSLGAILLIYDSDKCAEKALAEKLTEQNYPVFCGLSLGKALGRVSLIYDASPGRGLITGEQVDQDTLIAAPGLPLGLTVEAFNKVRAKLIHDPLQIGVATMLCLSLVKPAKSKVIKNER